MTARLVLFCCLPILLTPAVFSQPGPEPATEPRVQEPAKLWVFIGTYTRGTKSKGIYRCELDVATGKLTEPKLAVEADNPTFLAIHPTRKFLYAVSEIDDFGKEKEGSIDAYRLDTKDGTLELINQLGSGGTGPCHLVVDPTGKVVLAANYGGGSVCAMLLDHAKENPEDRGRLVQRTSLAQHNGSSVNKSRQEAPHAHSINTDPAGRLVLAADLGVDKIALYKLDPDKGTLAIHKPNFVDLAPGAGPRHLTFHPSGKRVYVLNELDGTVTGFNYDAEAGNLKPFQTVSTLPKGFKGTNLSAEVVIHPSGKFLYASNRGYHSIVAFDIDDKTGKLKLSRFQTKNVKTPRNFAVEPSGTFMLVANQDADNLVVFRIDPKTGVLTDTGVAVQVPRPVCIKMVARNS